MFLLMNIINNNNNYDNMNNVTHDLVIHLMYFKDTNISKWTANWFSN